jgi:hypothetical protein
MAGALQTSSGGGRVGIAVDPDPDPDPDSDPVAALAAGIQPNGEPC